MITLDPEEMFKSELFSKFPSIIDVVIPFFTICPVFVNLPELVNENPSPFILKENTRNVSLCQKEEHSEHNFDSLELGKNM